MKRNIRIRLVCMMLALSAAAGVFGFGAYAQSEKGSSGSIVTAAWSAGNSTVTISGTLTHSALVSVPEGVIALIRVLPGEDEKEALASGEPIMTTPVSVRFSFSVKCTTLKERLAGYAVLIIGGGKRIVVDGPRIAGCSSKIPSDPAFKGLVTERTADIVNNGAAASVIDISPMNITEGSSGYCSGMFGVNYFFDRGITDFFDIQVRSFRAAGTDIYIRLTGLENFSENGSRFCALYAVLAFLFSRASKAGAQIRGVIVGRASDSLFEGAGMRDRYCSVLSAVGAAVSDFSPDCPVIVPLSDRTAPDGSCLFTDFIEYVAGYADTHTEMRITLLFECFLNPYGLRGDVYPEPEDISSDNMLTDTPEEPEISDSPGDETREVQTEESDTDAAGTSDLGNASAGTDADMTGIDASADTSTSTSAVLTVITDFGTGSADIVSSAEFPPEETGTEVFSAEETDAEITTAEGTTGGFVPQPNDPADGFYSVENLSDVLSVHSSLKKKYRCVSQYWMLSWHPEENSGIALTDCFLYSYLTAHSLGASVFFTETDVIGCEAFDGLSYCFENIDTDKSPSVTGNGYEAFGASSWKEIITSVGRTDYREVSLYEKSLSDKEPDYQGRYSIWNFTKGNDILGWYSGLGCSSLKSFSDTGDGGIRASFSDRNYSDIGVICETPEPLLKFEALGFDLSCTCDDADALIEIKVFLYSDSVRVEASSAIPVGKRQTLFIDTSGLPSNTSITAVRICVRPIIGADSGNYGIELYDVGVYSQEYGSSALASLVRSARDEMKTDSRDNTVMNKSVYIYSSIAIVFSALLIVGFAASDKKRKTTEKIEQERKNVHER